MVTSDMDVADRVPNTERNRISLPTTLTYQDLDRQHVLGVGSNATVYAAVGPEATPLALKEPHIGSTIPTDVADRFEREAALWGRVTDHPNVVTIHASGVTPRPWLALEQVDHGSLRSHDPGIAETLWFGVRLADALAHAHEAGVVHQDIIPTNILLRETPADTWPEPALTDWGVGALLDELAANPEALSPRYAAPEQFDPDQFGTPGIQTDIYQLGAVLYEQLTGRPPHTEPLADLPQTVCETQVPPVTGIVPTLPAKVDEVLNRSLAKDPDDRYASAGAFATALAELLAAQTAYEPELPDRNTVHQPDASSVPEYDRAATLDAEGFVQLTEGYFARREPAPMLDAWQRGLDLVDVRAGRAVDRDPSTTAGDTSGNGEIGADADTMATALVDSLSAGTDHAVLGPPASGKSTICKQVACTWFDRGYGPVFYRESGGVTFDRPAALTHLLARVDGHALVVVEDAVRPDSKAVFELLERIKDTEKTSVLVDAREGEWHEAGGRANPFDSDPIGTGRERFATTFVPRPDMETYERFIESIEKTVDTALDVDSKELVTDVRQMSAAGDARYGDGTRPGELFYLIHRLTMLAQDPLTEAPTTLTEAVKEIYEDLASAGERRLNVGLAINVLNATGIGVHPELVYAVVPDNPVVVDDAIDLLDGRIVFPGATSRTDEGMPHPAVHEAWSREFLACLNDSIDETTARQRFGQVITQILSMADSPELREQINHLLPKERPHLRRVRTDAEDWADGIIERLFSLGWTSPRLVPLFGMTTESQIDLPEACSAWTTVHQAYWRGVPYRIRGDLDRAEQEFCVFRDRMQSVADRGDVVPEPAMIGSRYDRDSRRTSNQPDSGVNGWLAVCLLELGKVAYKRRDFERARERYEESLHLCREADRPHIEAAVIKELGSVAYKQGEFDTARERYTESLHICRELGDRHHEAFAINNLGMVAHDRGDLETAQERYEESLELCRELGDRHREAIALQNLGIVAREQGALETGVKRLKGALALLREIGDRHGEATALNELGAIAREQDRLTEAEDFLKKGTALCQEVGDDQARAHALAYLGGVAREQGRLEMSATYLHKSLELYRELGDRHGEARALHELGDLARERDALERACSRFAEAVELYRSMDVGTAITVFQKTVTVCEELDRIGAAKDWCRQAIDFADETGRHDAQSEFAARLSNITEVGDAENDCDQ